MSYVETTRSILSNELCTRRVRVTPDMARAWLEAHARTKLKQRPIKAHDVDKLACDMEAGRWRVNGETIKFSGDYILDGQHRLLAIVQSGVTIDAFIVLNLDRETFDTIDIGRRRSGGDTLAVRGEHNVNALAAAIGWAIKLQRCDTFHGPTNHEVLAFLDEHPSIRASVAILKSQRTRLMQGGLLAGLHWTWRQLDPELADEVLQKLITGVGLMDGDSILLLRRRLEQNMGAKAKLPPRYVAALAIKAWNATRQGRRIVSLRWNEEESWPEMV